MGECEDKNASEMESIHHLLPPLSECYFTTLLRLRYDTQPLGTRGAFVQTCSCPFPQQPSPFVARVSSVWRMEFYEEVTISINLPLAECETGYLLVAEAGCVSLHTHTHGSGFEALQQPRCTCRHPATYAHKSGTKASARTT